MLLVLETEGLKMMFKIYVYKAYVCCIGAIMVIKSMEKGGVSFVFSSACFLFNLIDPI